MKNNTPITLIGSKAQHDIELDQLMRGPSLRGVSSRGLHWTEYLVEEHKADAGEREESAPSYASLIMWLNAGASREIKVSRGRFMLYIKHPGTFCFFPAGYAPACRSLTRRHFLVFAVRRSFLEALKLEMNRRPANEMRILTGFQDAELCQLVNLLSAEAARGGAFGRLYADSLAQAIAARLLLLSEKNREASPVEASPLPRHILKRVIERMRNLNADLDLRTLAAETGYSQRHFIRMFRAATGHTPHRFLVQLRLDHAKKLLRQHRASLIDVAASCGFSSHAHMTQVFRHVLGVTPSEYRNRL